MQSKILVKSGTYLLAIIFGAIAFTGCSGSKDSSSTSSGTVKLHIRNDK